MSAQDAPQSRRRVRARRRSPDAPTDTPVPDPRPGTLGQRVAAGPPALSTADAMDLQAQAGNEATTQLLAPTGGARGQKRKYGPGKHGDKKSEQKRLKLEFGTTVSGASHQSEHVVGYEPLAQTGDLPRAKSTRARDLENHAPAYQEVKPFHRDHIGTGRHGSADATAMNSTDYRNAQRSLVEAGDVSSAVQLNQLGYAFDEDFRAGRDDDASRMATDSYDVMVANLHELIYATGVSESTVAVDALQQAEMYLARRVAQTGQWPTADEITAAIRRFDPSGSTGD